MQAVREQLEFTYESGALESYLVIKAPKEGRVLQYQIEMAAGNTIPGVVPFQARQKDEMICIYYTITSRLTLSQFLRRRKLNRDDFLTLLGNIVRVLMDSESYLLHRNSFVLEPEHIFIHPTNLEIYLVYLPVQGDTDADMKFKSFLTELILQLADIEENNSDNFIQRIIAMLKSEDFSLSAFQKLLCALKSCDLPELRQETARNMAMVSAGVEMERQPHGHKFEKANHGEEKSNVLQPYLLPLIVIAAVNLVIVILLILNTQFFISMGNDPVTTFAAFGLIIAALDGLVLKKWKDRLEQKGDKEKETTGMKSPADFPKKEWSLTGQLELAYKAAVEDYKPSTGSPKSNRKDLVDNDFSLNAALSENPQQAAVQIKTFTDETTFLCAAQEKYPYLQSKQEGVLERISIRKSGFTIGRMREQVDYVSQNKAVGKVHAEFILREGAVFLKDLNSRNGTFINDARVDSNKEYEVKSSDKIAFANQEYTFVIP